MEKKTPTFRLDEIKAAFEGADRLRMSTTALKCMFALGFNKTDVVRVVALLTRQDFYKSMTTYADHRVWQDVYYTKYKDISLYVKFTQDDKGYFLISFKER